MLLLGLGLGGLILILGEILGLGELILILGVLTLGVLVLGLGGLILGVLVDRLTELLETLGLLGVLTDILPRLELVLPKYPEKLGNILLGLILGLGGI